MFNKQQFSEDLFMTRSRKKLSRAKVADETGVHQSTIQMLENGYCNPRINNFLSICEWMETEPNNYLKL